MNHKKTKELETFQLFMSSNLKTETEDIQKRLHEIKIPIITNDVEVAKFIAEYHLDNPENMINFFLDVSFAAVDNISSSVDDLKQIDLINSVSKIKSAENMYKLASDNPKEKKQYLWSAQNKLFDATEELKNKILLYIDKTREIDNYSKYKFKKRSCVLHIYLILRRQGRHRNRVIALPVISIIVNFNIFCFFNRNILESAYNLIDAFLAEFV